MNALLGCILPKPKLGVGLWKNSFDKKQERHWKLFLFLREAGIGYAKTHGNSRRAAREKYRERSGRTVQGTPASPRKVTNMFY